MRYILSNIEEYRFLFPFAKEHRKEPTLTEKIIWEKLRRNSLGYKFRRQHVIGNYIVDFVCIDKKLIVEIDGESHIGKEDFDEYRTKYLESMDFRVIRFSNEEVISQLDNVLRIIKLNLLTSPLPSPKERE
jgi:very-short-patch-repair endonuclease